MRAAVLCAIWLTACSSYDDLPLLDVDAVEPEGIEPGATLRIHGQGFPLGRVPIITLQGAVYRPATPPGSMDATLAGEVQSESLIEVPVGLELIDELGGRATVDGTLRIAFRAADMQRDVFAVQSIRLDFLPDTSAQLLNGTTREDAATPTETHDFGVGLSREESGTVGVGVVSVNRDGLAAIQGVKLGDVLVGIDGVSLYSWRDFVPDPSKTESTVFVTRSGLPGVHALRWPHAATQRRAAPLALAVFVLLGVLLGWLSPVALCLRKAATTTAPQAWLTRFSLILVFAAVLFCVSGIQWTTLWILVLGMLAALFAFAACRRAAVSSFAFTVLSTLTVMLLARTASISSIVAAQSNMPLRWYLFQSPASFLAFGAYLHALGTLAARGRLSASLYASAAAVLGAALFLGGWSSAEPLMGISMLVAKAAAILLAARVFEMSRNVAVTVSGLGIAFALAFVWADTEALFPYWSALAFGCSCTLALRAMIPALRRESALATA